MAQPHPVFPISVVMDWRRLKDRWGSEAWQASAVLPGLPAGAPGVQLLQQEADRMQYLVNGLAIELFRDDAEGYYVNWAAPEPRVFILWRMQDGRAMPVLATVSYAEGVRFADAGEQVDGVPMPAPLHHWLGVFVEAHYRPQPRLGRSRHE